MAKKKALSKVSLSKRNLNIKKLDYKKFTKKPKLGQKQLVILAVFVGFILFGVSGWAYFTKILINPTIVLNDAIENNLQTTSVTRTVVQSDGQQNIEQISHLSFGTPTFSSESQAKLSQKGRNRQNTTITTETIGVKDADYVRYSAIEGAENMPGTENFQKLVGIWASQKNDPTTGSQAGFLNESLFSVVPFANLDQEARKKVLELINQKNLYSYKSAQREVQNYRQVYVYRLEIKPSDLIEVLAKYAELTGAADPKQFNPEDYRRASPVAVQMTVDILSRQIVKIEYAGSQRTEKYSGHNLYRPVTLPENPITIEELQKKLQDSSSGSQS